MKTYLQAYLKEKPLFFSFLRPKEAELYQQFKPFKNPILDVGCGDGFFAKVAFGSTDVGIDPDKKAIAEARKRNVYKTVKQYDGKKIPYPDKYFSTIVCNSTFEHITNLDEVLLEVSRVLKRGGMLYFTVPTNRWASYLFGRELFGKIYEDYFTKKSKHYNLLSFQEWKKILKSLGLEVVYKTYYLDSTMLMWFFDIAHYLSAFSLLSKKLFDRWVIVPQKTPLLYFMLSPLSSSMQSNSNDGPYMFIAAKKL